MHLLIALKQEAFLITENSLQCIYNALLTIFKQKIATFPPFRQQSRAHKASASETVFAYERLTF